MKELNLYQEAGLHVDVALAYVVQELVAAHEQDRGVVPVLDVHAAAGPPEHLVLAAEQVAEISGGHGKDLAPDGEANPGACTQGNQTHVVNFLVTAAYAHKNHLVYAVPPVPVNIQVELGKFAHPSNTHCQ